MHNAYTVQGLDLININLNISNCTVRKAKLYCVSAISGHNYNLRLKRNNDKM